MYWVIGWIISVIVALGVGMVGGTWLLLRYKLQKHIDAIVAIINNPDLSDMDKVKAIAKVLGIWPW